MKNPFLTNLSRDEQSTTRTVRLVINGMAKEHLE